MNLLAEQVKKRAFKRSEQINLGRFFQSAGTLGISKSKARRMLTVFIKKKEIKTRNRQTLELICLKGVVK